MSEKKRERERVLFVVKLRVRRKLKSVRRLADRLLYSEGPRSEAVKKEREWEGMLGHADRQSERKIKRQRDRGTERSSGRRKGKREDK